MMILQKNRGASCFFEVCDAEIPSNYEIRMLQNNSFKYIPPTELREIDGRKSIYVKIDGLGTLVSRFRKYIPEKKELEKLLISIKRCMSELQDYMLDPGGMVIDMEHILYSSGEDRYKFVYIPGYNLSFRKQMKDLFEDIMRIFDHKDQDGVVYLYDLYSKILMENFTPDLFCKLIKEKEDIPIKAKVIQTVPEIKQETDFRTMPDTIEEIKTEDKDKNRNIVMIITAVAVAVFMYIFLGSQSLMISAVMALVMAVYIGVDMMRKKEEEETRLSMEPLLTYGSYVAESDDEIRRPEIEKKEEPKRLFNEIEVAEVDEPEFFETTVLMDGNELTNDLMGISRLIPCEGNNNDQIYLIEGETRIGRMSDACDICIDEPSISRVHVVLEKQGKTVTLKDVGSTNGTYLNEHRLEKDISEQLTTGDIISLAGLAYECR
ncbi:MAG: FHA domain-containing protein [Eubacterium sp.]|nr:FHA domain-containing protein [Eubacterium sp.]